jgi:Response regulator receiver domain
MNMIAPRNLAQDHDFLGSLTASQQGVVVIVSDVPGTIENLTAVCEFLEFKIEVVSAGSDLSQLLLEHRPMAVISDVEGGEQDGLHTMKIIARYSRDLPIMLLTDGDPVLMGAADAVQDLWGLTSVTRTSGFPVAGQLVAFLFGAGRRAGCMRLLPV